METQIFDNELDFLNKIQRKKYDINCQLITEWDENEINNAKRLLYKLKNSSYNQNLKDSNYFSIADSNFAFEPLRCESFRYALDNCYFYFIL